MSYFRRFGSGGWDLMALEINPGDCPSGGWVGCKQLELNETLGHEGLQFSAWTG